MKTMTENIAGPCVGSMGNFIVFERFGVDSRKRVKTLVWTQIDRCVFDDNKNTLVWFEKDRIARCKRTCSPALPDLCLLLMSTHIFRKFGVFRCVAETTVDSWLVSYCVVMSFQCMNYVMW